jgi:hypothetical protein
MKGQALPLTFHRADIRAEQLQEMDKNYIYASPADLQGHWKGTLDLKQVKLRLIINIAKLSDGTFSASMESLDQGANEIPANSIIYSSPNVRIEWNGLNGVFNGRLNNGKLSGSFKQGPQTFPLNLERGIAE